MKSIEDFLELDSSHHYQKQSQFFNLDEVQSPPIFTNHKTSHQLIQTLDYFSDSFGKGKRSHNHSYNKKNQNTSKLDQYYDNGQHYLNLNQKINGNKIQRIDYPKEQTNMKQQTQTIKRLQQQNRFLKQKIENLSFRLRQTEGQLNKLKFNGNNNTANFQSMKQACLKQLNQIVRQNQGSQPVACKLFHDLKNMTSFDGKIKIDLLNYFMSELLENIINDHTFYFIQSIMSQKGIWSASKDIKLRKVDQQLIQVMELNQNNRLDKFKNDLAQALHLPSQKYKSLWKTFYKSYTNLLNQGFILQNFLRNSYYKIQQYLPRENILKAQLHFQKIKLRKDIRQLRQSWFKQFQFEENKLDTYQELNTQKRKKVSK